MAEVQKCVKRLQRKLHMDLGDSRMVVGVGTIFFLMTEENVKKPNSHFPRNLNTVPTKNLSASERDLFRRRVNHLWAYGNVARLRLLGKYVRCEKR